jgi:hypothetical protein
VAELKTYTEREEEGKKRGPWIGGRAEQPFQLLLVVLLREQIKGMPSQLGGLTSTLCGSEFKLIPPPPRAAPTRNHTPHPTLSIHPNLQKGNTSEPLDPARRLVPIPDPIRVSRQPNGTGDGPLAAAAGAGAGRPRPRRPGKQLFRLPVLLRFANSTG